MFLSPAKLCAAPGPLQFPPGASCWPSLSLKLHILREAFPDRLLWPSGLPAQLFPSQQLVHPDLVLRNGVFAHVPLEPSGLGRGGWGTLGHGIPAFGPVPGVLHTGLSVHHRAQHPAQAWCSEGLSQCCLSR